MNDNPSTTHSHAAPAALAGQQPSAAQAADTEATISLTLGGRQLEALDQWANDHGGVTRAEAARSLIERGLAQTSSLMRSS